MLLSKSKRAWQVGRGGWESDDRCWEHDRHEALADLRLQFCFSDGQGDYRNSDAIRRTVEEPKRYKYRYRGTDNVHPLETKLKISTHTHGRTQTQAHIEKKIFSAFL